MPSASIQPPQTTPSAALCLVLLFAVAFLLGSIPWGVVISKLVYKKDLRKEGSGNIGTTNAMRSLGKVGGAAVFVLDFGKGLLSGFAGLQVGAWLAQNASLFGWIGSATQNSLCHLCSSVAFLGCVWGHVFTPWLGFKGGKGIAVAIGCLFFTFGLFGSLLEIAVFAVCVVATRYVSVGSLAAAAVCPFIALYLYWGDWLAWFFCCIAAVTVLFAHRANMKRLRAGTENRIGDKKKAA